MHVSGYQISGQIARLPLPFLIFAELSVRGQKSVPHAGPALRTRAVGPVFTLSALADWWLKNSGPECEVDKTQAPLY